MRPTTLACARFESKGKPELTETLIDASIADILTRLTRWVLANPMGHNFQFVVARTQEELDRISRSAGPQVTREDVAEQVMEDIMSALADCADDLIDSKEGDDHGR